MDFDAKRMKNLRTGEPPHVSISHITNERKNADKNKRADLRKHARTDALAGDNRTTNEETSERAKGLTDCEPENGRKGSLANKRTHELIGQRGTTHERASELTNKQNNQQKIGPRTKQKTSERTNYHANARTKKRTSEQSNKRTNEYTNGTNGNTSFTQFAKGLNFQ